MNTGDSDPEFDPSEWSKQLADRIELELFMWHRKVGVDRIRAFAIECYPWHPNVLCLSLLTDREWPDFDSDRYRWDIASWRLYAFTSTPDSQWPYGEKVLRDAKRYYDHADKTTEVARRRDVIIQCCVDAIQATNVQDRLDKYTRTPDFELYVGHADAPGRNFVRAG